MNLTAESQVVRQLSGMLGQVPFSRLRSLNSQNYFFDDQGIELRGSDAAVNASAAIFRATLQIPSSRDPNLPEPTALPSAAAAVSERLATVVIQITRNGSSQTVRKYPVYVADRGW